jgi:starch phosphorylase
VGTEAESGELRVRDQHIFKAVESKEAGETVFALDLAPRLPGLQYYKIRMYPFHPALAHRLETGYMIWL